MTTEEDEDSRGRHWFSTAAAFLNLGPRHRMRAISFATLLEGIIPFAVNVIVGMVKIGAYHTLYLYIRRLIDGYMTHFYRRTLAASKF
jgi:hypothetical protein